jgi:hypothetical protein
MQDIGGCRLVVDGRADVDHVSQQLHNRALPHYVIQRTADYRDDGRQDTGYRALHLIVKRDGLQLEVQLRTRRQHGWAEAVERVANRTGYRLKDGEGPSDLIRYFKTASDCLCDLDNMRLPNSSQISDLRRYGNALRRHLREPAEGEHFAISPKSYSTRENNWILVYNWRTGQREHWMDCGPDARQAARTLSEYEFRFPWRDGYEVVLIGSDSEKTIEWTHAHYFGRTPDDLDPHGVLAELQKFS